MLKREWRVRPSELIWSELNDDVSKDVAIKSVPHDTSVNQIIDDTIAYDTTLGTVFILFYPYTLVIGYIPDRVLNTTRAR